MTAGRTVEGVGAAEPACGQPRRARPGRPEAIAAPRHDTVPRSRRCDRLPSRHPWARENARQRGAPRVCPMKPGPRGERALFPRLPPKPKGQRNAGGKPSEFCLLRLASGVPHGVFAGPYGLPHPVRHPQLSPQGRTECAHRLPALHPPRLFSTATSSGPIRTRAVVREGPAEPRTRPSREPLRKGPRRGHRPSSRTIPAIIRVPREDGAGIMGAVDGGGDIFFWRGPMRKGAEPFLPHLVSRRSHAGIEPVLASAAVILVSRHEVACRRAPGTSP